LPIDIKTVDSPGWWLYKLTQKLQWRLPRLERLQSRLEGEGPLPTGAENVQDAYRSFQQKARTNYAELIIRARGNRMMLNGFRTGAGGDDNGDAEAARIWQANGMHVEASDVHEHMLALGDAYVIVGDIDPETNAPVITAEDPRQVVTIHDPVQQRKVRAGLKLFRDNDLLTDFAYVFLRREGGPAELWVATRDIQRANQVAPLRFSPQAWNWSDLSTELPFEQVPVVRFRNRNGVGVYERHCDLLDRIDHQVLQRMVIATFQAFRQRAAKGLPDEDDAGNQIDYNALLTADPGGLWLLPEGADLWESGQIDLTPVLSAVKDDIKSLAAVTETPLSVFMPDNVVQAAEGAAFAREGLVFEVEDLDRRAGEAWKDVMALAFRWMDDPLRADRSSLEVLWASPERRSLAERADAGSKASDIPWETRMTKVWQFSPEEVAQMKSQRAADAVLAAGLIRPVAPAAPAVAAAAPVNVEQVA
jgi:hypothetical protein